MITTTYTVTIEGVTVGTHTDLHDAIRDWNSRTFHGVAPVGGIAVVEHSDGIMVRDGNILRVTNNGRVYLNPNLTTD